MIHIDAETLDIIRKLKAAALPESAELIAFGSRVNSEPPKLADLDIAVKNASPEDIAQFAEYLAVAPTSARVDISDFNTIPDWLKQEVNTKGEKF